MASSRDMPRSTKRSVSCCRCARISSSISRSCCSRVCGLAKMRRNFAESVRSRAITVFLLGGDAELGGSWLFSFQFEDATDYARDAFPLRGFESELARSCFCDPIELRFAIIFGGAPIGGDPALLLEAEQGSVDGAFIQFEDVFADLLDTAGNAEAVLRAEGVERFEDHEVEGALEDVGFG